MSKKLTFQEIILTLQQFWNDQGCIDDVDSDFEILDFDDFDDGNSNDDGDSNDNGDSNDYDSN